MESRRYVPGANTMWSPSFISRPINSSWSCSLTLSLGVMCQSRRSLESGAIDVHNYARSRRRASRVGKPRLHRRIDIIERKQDLRLLLVVASRVAVQCRRVPAVPPPKNRAARPGGKSIRAEAASVSCKGEIG